ncbi:MAG: DNA primase [Candidatus Liptonbacteria bacterium]|nr:DNA primase [Candidatus Liptonbacteria bacterium]
MPGAPSELIKEKLDIVEFLKGYLTLQPAGKNFKALCPFHREKTPSFMVSPDRQSWHCFGCSLGGDIFSFLMQYENLEFVEALKVLAEKAGIELRHASPSDYKLYGLLYEINDAAKVFFVRELESSSGARAYLERRSLTKETIGEFEIGSAPDNPEALNLHLIHLGYRPEDIVRAGLVIKTERGRHIDRFRGRIMFPIHNHFGKVAGFTGRVMPEHETEGIGKYVNSSESPIFSKSKLLYGYWKSKPFIRGENAVFLVEGQMDFLMSWQLGVKHAVATSGTALTGDHLRALRKLADRLIVSFDTDEAGLAAGERAIDLAEAHDFTVSVAAFKGSKDPAEAAAKDPRGFGDGVKNARPAPEHYFERYLAPYLGAQAARGLADASFRRKLRTVLGKLKNISSAVERSLWFRELGKRIGIEEQVLLEEANAVEANPTRRDSADEAVRGEEPRTFSRRELLSQRLLAHCVAANDFSHAAASVVHFDPQSQEMYEILKRGERRAPAPAMDALINLVVLQAGSVEGERPDELKRYLAEEYAKERRRSLTEAIRSAELSGDEAAIRAALAEFQNRAGNGA